MSPDPHSFLAHPEFLMSATMPDLRNPVGAHLRRTIEATDRHAPDGSGVALGVILGFVFFVALGGLVWGFYEAGLVMP